MLQFHVSKSTIGDEIRYKSRLCESDLIFLSRIPNLVTFIHLSLGISRIGISPEFTFTLFKHTLELTNSKLASRIPYKTKHLSTFDRQSSMWSLISSNVLLP